jgi:hypothetical protein
LPVERQAIAARRIELPAVGRGLDTRPAGRDETFLIAFGDLPTLARPL